MQDPKELFEKRHEELVKIIQAFENLEKSKEWETLKELIFSKALISIDKQIQLVAQATPIDSPKLYSLQGERLWALRYCNIDKLITGYIHELEEVNKKIK